MMGYARREDALAYLKTYRESHRENARQATIEWRAANGERRRPTDRRWRAANREKTREATRRFAQNHPDKIRDNTARQRARRKPVLVAGAVCRLDVWARDNGVCGICGQSADPASWHVDHIVPIARGGIHAMSNVQVSHPTCNRRKGTR